MSSGRTQTPADRRARGFVRVTVWLTPAEAALLDKLGENRAAGIRYALTIVVAVGEQAAARKRPRPRK